MTDKRLCEDRRGELYKIAEEVREILREAEPSLMFKEAVRYSGKRKEPMRRLYIPQGTIVF